MRRIEPDPAALPPTARRDHSDSLRRGRRAAATRNRGTRLGRFARHRQRSRGGDEANSTPPPRRCSAGCSPRRRLRRSRQKLSAYQAQGHDYVQIADTRRDALREYAEPHGRHGSARSARRSIGLGRYLAGSLPANRSCRCAADLEELRRRFAARNALRTATTSVRRIRGEQRARAATRHSSATRAVSRDPKGADWVRQMREDIAQSELAARVDRREPTPQSRDSANRVSADPRAAHRLPLPSIPNRRPSRSRAAVAPPAARARGAEPRAPIVPAVASPVPDAITTTTVPDEHERRTTIACHHRGGARGAVDHFRSDGAQYSASR